MNKGASGRCLALLPARGGSKRIPKKNITDFHGAPMLSYPLKAAQNSGLFDLIHVSTDSDDIAQIGRDLGADVSFMRPPELSDDFTGMLPVARWVLEKFDSLGQHFDDVVILFPAAPLLVADDLKQAYNIYQEHNRKRNLLTVCRAPTFMEWYYKRQDDGRLTPVQKGGAFIRSQELEPIYYETGTFTIFSKESLLDAADVNDDENYISYELPIWKSVDLDTPEDLDYAKILFEVMRAHKNKG